MRHRTTSTTPLLVCALLLWSTLGRAEANACASAYEQAQELRAEQHLRQAQRSLEACIEPSCPEFIRTECGRWLVEVETSLPTIVLSAKTSGSDANAVRVLCDGAPLVESLDGKAIPVDPGPHTLTFVTDAARHVELKVVLREGEKNRIIEAELGEPKVPTKRAAQAPVVRSEQVLATNSGSNWLPYGFGGLGVLGVTGFAVLGMLGNRDLEDREARCAPSCTDADVSSVKTKYYLADLSLGVGIVSLGVAGYLFLSSPNKAVSPASVGQNSSLDVRLLKGGSYAAVRMRF